MYDVKVWLKDGQLIVQLPYEIRDRIKSLGAQWWPDRKSWTLPASPSTMQKVAALGACPDSVLLKNQAFEDAVARYEKARDAKDSAGELDQPTAIKSTMWPHQRQGYHFARNLDACMLCMDMGTGKTLTALAVLADLLETSPRSRALIICPRYVVPVWPKEIFKRTTMTPTVAGAHKTGDKDEEGFDLWINDTGTIPQRIDKARGAMRWESFVYVVNYEALAQDAMREFLAGIKWDLIILDESHRIKAPGGKISRFIRTVLRKRATKRLCLTGTPMPNNCLDIYAQYAFLDHNIFDPSFYLFKQRFCIVDNFGKPRSFINQDEMTHKIYSIAFRVMATDVLTLPEKQDITLYCELESKAKQAYEGMRKHMLAEVDAGILTAANAAVKLLRLRQITGGWLPLDTDDGQARAVRIGDEKQRLLHELLEDLPAEQPAVVFCQFHHDLDAVHDAAKALGRSSGELSGRVNACGLTDWQAGKTTILAAQIDSARDGIDLTRACVGV